MKRSKMATDTPLSRHDDAATGRQIDTFITQPEKMKNLKRSPSTDKSTVIRNGCTGGCTRARPSVAFVVSEKRDGVFLRSVYASKRIATFLLVSRPNHNRGKRPTVVSSGLKSEMTVSTSTTLESPLNGAHPGWSHPACHRGRRVALLKESTRLLHVSFTFLIPASPQGTALARQAGLVSKATSPTLAAFQCGVLTLRSSSWWRRWKCLLFFFPERGFLVPLPSSSPLLNLPFSPRHGPTRSRPELFPWHVCAGD